MTKKTVKEINKTIKLIVGSDNGNSEHDIVINGNLIQQPNVYAKISRLPNLDEVNPLSYANDIENHLIATITSQRLNNGTPTTYFVGNYAINSGNHVYNIEIGADNSKLDSDIPFVNTLAQIAGYGASMAYLEDNTVEEITIDVDMTTALPVNQYSKDASLKMSEQFIGKHKVSIYFGTKIVNCNLIFDYVKTIPEAVPTVFYLQSNKDSEVFEEYKKDYKLQEVDFENKKILHVAIGEGTTEYPLTNDIAFNPSFLTGTNNGVGLAIESIIEDFRKDYRLPVYTRQDFSSALKNPNNKYHTKAVDYVQEQLEYQSEEIFRTVKREVEKAKNDVDIIAVYGGGSILMKKYLKQKIAKFADEALIQVLYIDKPFSVSIEALGMYEFTKSDVYKNLKEKFINK